MATLRQITANRRNAVKSTGPKTDVGKDVARQNSLQHGVFAAAALLPDEDPAAFAHLHQSYIDLYEPVSPTEHFLINRIVFAAWRLNRLAAMEVRILAAQHAAAEDRAALNAEILRLVGRVFSSHKPESARSLERESVSGQAETSAAPDRTDHIAKAYIRDSEHGNAIFKFARYQTSLERSYYRALHELLHLRSSSSPSSQ